jgi:hypothetical protein
VLGNGAPERVALDPVRDRRLRLDADETAPRVVTERGPLQLPSGETRTIAASRPRTAARSGRVSRPAYS